MIKKIKIIKNLGIFSDYQWDGSILPDFERYNILYGWNGSGKTTLTKLFSALEKGATYEYPDLKYEILSDTGIFKNGQNFNKKIRVFNQNYINNNIEITGSRAKPIFILGEENKAIAEQIEKDEKTLKELEDRKKELEELKTKKEAEKGKKFTDVAKIIGANTSGTSVRNYRKPEAEKAFALLSNKNLLTPQEINNHSLTLKQEEKSKISEIDLSNPLQVLETIIKDSEGLCLQTIESLVIEKLKQNPGISQWVESGLTLHLKHKSEKCEFCDQKIPPDRIKKLINHFNTEDQKLKRSLNEKISKLKEITKLFESLILTDKANLYAELQTEYVSRIITFNKERINLLTQISESIKILEDKKNKTTEKVLLTIILDDKFKKSINKINDSFQIHNQKTINFQRQRDEAQKALEIHYLSEIYDEVKNLEKDIKDCDEKINIANTGNEKILGIFSLNRQITTNKAVISSTHKACEILNQKLTTFLGRKEIIFEVSSSGGYLIKRNGKIAKNLSEGEKTAIAFVHFTVQLNDQNFKLQDGIIIIDDPISSLDSNSLFQAFSFLKISVEKAKQVFIFTHNFDFLRLLLNWLNYFNNKPNKLKPYYMVCNKIENSERLAEITILDPLLANHESEYHYLCKLLFKLETDGTIASIYHIPNVARKVLETFLMFRVPNGDNIYKKLETLKFDDTKKTAIYKFTNDQSHITGKGFDPSLIPETQKNVKYLLEMIEKVFPEHFNILKSSITANIDHN